MHDWEPFQFICFTKPIKTTARYGNFPGKTEIRFKKGERLILDKKSKSGDTAIYRTEREEVGHPYYWSYSYDKVVSGGIVKPCGPPVPKANVNAYENVSQISSAGGRRKTRRRMRRSRKN